MFPVVFILVVFGCNKQESLSGLQPFSVNHANTGTGAIDISFLFEKPAGKNEFINSKNGKLVKPNGERIRLWGVNITDWTKGSVQIPERKEAELYANTLTRYGINCVRLTFLDFFTPRGIIDPEFNHTQNLDSVQLDKLGFWICKLKDDNEQESCLSEIPVGFLSQPYKHWKRKICHENQSRTKMLAILANILAILDKKFK